MSDNYLEPHQSRSGTPSAYESRLAGAIEEAFGRGAYELPALVAELSATGIAAADGSRFTEESFLAQLGELGA